MSRFVPAGWLLPLFVAMILVACGADDDDVAEEPDSQQPDAASVLDGTEEVQEAALADLAFERAQLGAEWLATMIREDGAFYYEYFPEDDTVEVDEYNEVRHAGTTYSMFQVYDATGGDEILEAAEAAIGYIDDSSPELPIGGRGFIYDQEVKLGGQALALVALLERRRALADTSHDALIEEMTEFLLAMETDTPGLFYNHYFARTDDLVTGESRFYPGEALLALTRLAYHFPDGPYLEIAVRAADYLVYQRDGDLSVATDVPEEDHWLAIALSELYRLQPNEDYARLAYLHAESMVSNQITEEDDVEPLIGASGSPESPNSFTSIATKGEALAAVWALAVFKGDDDVAGLLAEASWRNAQFRMRVQYTDENTAAFPNPEAAEGAWGADPAEEAVRIDYVQHNITALIWVYYMTIEGDVPLPEPLEVSSRESDLRAA